MKNQGFLLHLKPLIGDSLSNGLYKFIVDNIERAQSIIGSYGMTVKDPYIIIDYTPTSHIRIDKTFSTINPNLSFAHYTDESTEPKTHVYYQPDGIIHNPDESGVLLDAQEAQQKIVQVLLDQRKKHIEELDKKITTAEAKLYNPKSNPKDICTEILERLKAKNNLSLNTRDPREELIEDYLTKLQTPSQNRRQSIEASFEPPAAEKQAETSIELATPSSSSPKEHSRLDEISHLVQSFRKQKSLLDKFQTYHQLEALITERLILNSGSLNKKILKEFNYITQEMSTPDLLEEALLTPGVDLRQVSFAYERSPYFSKLSAEQKVLWREDFLLTKYLEDLKTHIGRTSLILEFLKKYWLLNPRFQGRVPTHIDNIGLVRLSSPSLLALADCTSEEKIQALELIAATNPYALDYTTRSIAVPTLNHLSFLAHINLFDDIEYYIAYLRSALKVRRRFAISDSAVCKNGHSPHEIVLLLCPNTWLLLLTELKNEMTIEDYNHKARLLDATIKAGMIDDDPLAFLLTYTQIKNSNDCGTRIFLSSPTDFRENAYLTPGKAIEDLKHFSNTDPTGIAHPVLPGTVLSTMMLKTLLPHVMGLNEKTLLKALEKCTRYTEVIKNTITKKPRFKHLVAKDGDPSILFTKTSITILELLIQQKAICKKDISRETNTLCEQLNTLHSFYKTSEAPQHLEAVHRIHQALQVKQAFLKYKDIDLDTLSKQEIRSILLELKPAQEACEFLKSKKELFAIPEVTPKVEEALTFYNKLKNRFLAIMRAETTPGLFQNAAAPQATGKADKTGSRCAP